MDSSEQKRNDQFDEAKHYNLLRKNKYKLREARSILFIIAGLNVLSVLFLSGGMSKVALFINIGYSLFFVIMGLISIKIPKESIIVSLVVYLTVTILAGIINPMSFLQGILIKILIIGGLIKGFVSANEALKHQEKLKEVEHRLKTYQNN